MILPALSLWEPYAFSVQQHQTPPSFAILILIWHERGSAGSLTWSCLMLPPVINRKGPKKQTVYSTALIFSIYHLSGMHSVTILKKKKKSTRTKKAQLWAWWHPGTIFLKTGKGFYSWGKSVWNCCIIWKTGPSWARWSLFSIKSVEGIREYLHSAPEILVG